MTTSVEIDYRIVYNTDDFQVGRYGVIYDMADTYNDIIGITYDKMLELASTESINLTNGDTQIDSFYVEDDNNGNHKVPKNKYDINLIQNHYRFKISLIWTSNNKNYIPPPPLLVRQNAGPGPFD